MAFEACLLILQKSNITRPTGLIAIKRYSYDNIYDFKVLTSSLIPNHSILTVTFSSSKKLGQHTQAPIS